MTSSGYQYVMEKQLLTSYGIGHEQKCVIVEPLHLKVALLSHLPT